MLIPGAVNINSLSPPCTEPLPLEGTCEYCMSYLPEGAMAGLQLGEGIAQDITQRSWMRGELPVVPWSRTVGGAECSLLLSLV